MMRRLLRVGILALALTCSAAWVPGWAAGASLKVSCDNCKPFADEWARQTGNEVQIVNAPTDSGERLAHYQAQFASGLDKLDVVEIDTVWTHLLARFLVDLRPLMGGAEAAHFPWQIANNTVAGRLVAMPWFVDVGLLFYRKDLLDKYGATPPATWDELAATAARIQAAERKAGNATLWGFVWQGRAYEGLSCNALEWLAGQGGGHIIEADGQVSVDNPQAAKALARAAGWVGSISPRAVLNFAEEEARGVFHGGGAVFMRGWAYAWSLSQRADSPVKGKVGVSPLPSGLPGGPRIGTLGGWQLAVPRSSRHAQAAADLVRWLTGERVQKQRAIDLSLNPTLPALYRDPEILRANPLMAELVDSLNGGVARPSAVAGSRYPQASALIWTAVRAVLSGGSKPADAVAQLQRDLGALLQRQPPN